jgi:hypothetical protein
MEASRSTNTWALISFPFKSGNYMTISCSVLTQTEAGIANSVRWLGHRLDDWRIVVRFPAEAAIFLFSTASRQALGPSQLHIQRIPLSSFPGGKRTGHEEAYVLQLVAMLRMCWAIPPLPHVFMAWWLIKHRDYFTLLYLRSFYCQDSRTHG